MSGLRVARMPALIALVGLVLTSLLVALLQGTGDVLPAIRSFASGVAGSPIAIGATGENLAPILLIAVAATVAFRAGLFDVGQVGQFVFGGLFAGAVAPAVPGPGIVVILVSLLAGMAAGALWATLVYRIVRATGLQLVVISLVANYVAESFAALMTRVLFQDPTAYDVAATRPVPQRAWLPLLIPQTAMTIGLLVAVAAVIVAWLVVTRTAVGHRLTMFGRNPLAATLAGVDAPRFQGHVLSVGGAICGLAGAIEVLGVFHGYQDGTLGGTDSIAWTGLNAAILVPAGVLALLPVSLLLAALNTGFDGIQLTLGLSSGLSTLLAGVVIITAAFAVRNPVSRASGRRDSPRTSRRDPEPSTRRTATGPHNHDSPRHDQLMLHQLITTNLWFLTLQAATPLLFASLGVYLPMRAGVLNLGAEGVMLFGCFGAVLVEAKTGGSTLFGVLGGAGAGALVCAVLALLTITLRANLYVIGLALNFVASGATVVATTAIYGTSGTIATPNLGPLPVWNLPGVKSIPWVGQVISGQTSLTYVAVVLAVALAWALAHTRWGLTVRVTGSRPDVADAMHRPVSRTQWQALVLGGALLGLGGAALALSAAAQFTPDMTSGRGFIALALAMIATRKPIMLLPLSITFALFESLGINLQQFGLPAELSSALPYIAVIVLLLVPKPWQQLRAHRTQADVELTPFLSPALATSGEDSPPEVRILSDTSATR